MRGCLGHAPGSAQSESYSSGQEGNIFLFSLFFPLYLEDNTTDEGLISECFNRQYHRAVLGP